MSESVRINADGIEIEATKDLVEARQVRIFSVIKACCEQLDGAASVTLDKLARALTTSGIRSDRRQVATALNEMLHWGQVARKRRGNKFYYWLPEEDERDPRTGMQPMFNMQRGGVLAGVSTVSAPRVARRRTLSAEEMQVVQEAASLIQSMDQEPETPDAPEPAPGAAENAAETTEDAPEPWLCPDHPHRTPQPSRYNQGELFCPARVNGGHCRNTNRNTLQLGQKPPSNEPLHPSYQPGDRSGYVDQVVAHMGSSFFSP